MVTTYIKVMPAAVYVCKVLQAQSLQGTVTMLQSNLHRFLLKHMRHFFLEGELNGSIKQSYTAL